ncbi:DNase I-like protein [Xylaria intraflava]|nr:DNase I-like protein [Xylaria intraflava]
MEQLPLELNLVTLNCWGRKYTSSSRQERITAIGRYLATIEPLPHIVALQECFEHEDYLSIRRETRFALPFGKFYSGAFSSGLVILSRWPIEESSMVPFSLGAPATGLFRGGLSVETQGVACARIRYGEGEEDVVEVFNTSTHPSYGAFSQNSNYTIQRLSQAWEITKLVRGAAERGHLSVVLAGFNAAPLSLPYRLLTSHAPIRDAWRVLYPDSSLGSTSHELERARGRPIPTAAFNIAENGVTSNSAYNTWAWSSSEQRALRSGKRPMLISPETPDEDGHRADYIFFSRGGDPHAFPTDLSEILSAHNTYTDDGIVNAPSPGWVVKDARVGLMARHPELGCSLSDHFSVEATLILHTPAMLRHRHRRRSRSRSRTRSSSRARSTTLGDEAATSPRKSSIRTSGQTLHDTPTPNTFNTDTGMSTRPGRGERERGRPATISTSNAEIHTAAMEHGTYLQSPAASSRRGSQDRWDLQLSNQELGSSPRLALAAYDEIVRLIDVYAMHMRRRRGLGIAHFIFWAVVLIGSYVGIWFLPGGKGGFGLLVASSLGFAAGAANLVFALLYYPAELNRLAEFEWEIRNAKAIASGMSPELLAHQRSGEEKVW